MTSTCSVITIATNKLSYATFALNMAQSVVLHNDINVYIISNLDFDIPAQLKNNVFIIRANEEHAALGIGMKLYIDKYLQTENSLFIDSDCLCYASLEPVFEACKGKNVTVVGTMVNASGWVGGTQAQTIEKEFGISRLIRFNGGMYYLKKSEVTTKIYEFARSIIPDYDSLGFQRINSKMINEEGPVSIAMVQYHETPIPDNGRYMTDLYTDMHPRGLNVLKGIRVLKNPANGMAGHRAWYPEGQYSPIIIHFGGGNLKSYIYLSQAALIRLHRYHIGNNLATFMINMFVHIPFKSARWLVGLLRR